MGIVLPGTYHQCSRSAVQHHLDIMECNYAPLGGIDNWLFPSVAEVTLVYIATIVVTQ